MKADELADAVYAMISASGDVSYPISLNKFGNTLLITGNDGSTYMLSIMRVKVVPA